MAENQDVNYNLICAVREGRLGRVRALINSFGLSYSQAWSEGYLLLRDAVKKKHAAVAELLLTSGSKVNSKNKNPSNTPLHFAVINVDIVIIKMILDKGANINAENQLGRTPLHYAIGNGKLEVTELLLKHGADVNALDNDGTSPLHVAAEIGLLEIVDLLLKYGAYVNYVCTSTWTKGYTPLTFAVEKGDKEVVTLLLSRGANVDVKGEDNITPLHIAAMRGYVYISEELLNHGACIHSLTLKEGYSPLHFASELGNEKAVKLFLNEGADINASTNDNLTPLHIATKSGHKTIVKLLLQHGAKVDNQDKDGKTILHLAVEKGYLTIVEDILKYGPDIQCNKNYLEIAVYGYGNECEKIVETLLEYGISFNTENANNPRLLHAAVEKGYLKIIEELLKYGADVNTLSDSGFTPLHYAAKNTQEEVAKLLISYEAHINAQDETGKPPIFYAVDNGDLKIIKLLLTNRANIKNNPEILNIAVKKECIEIVKVLLQHDADINASDKDGRTALHFTALSESEGFYQYYDHEDPDSNVKGEIAKLLLSKDANVDAQIKNGVTTLHAATQNGYIKVVEALLEYNANVNSRIESGKTALHLGAKTGYPEMIQTLLKFGAHINSRDKHGETALHIASREGHTEAVETLLEYGSDINITNIFNCTSLHETANRIHYYYSQIQYYNANEDYNYEPGDDPHRFLYSCDATAKDLKCQIVKMKTANLYVSKNNLRYMSSSYKIDDFEDECGEEIASMKSEKINNSNISFYDILAQDTSSLTIYIKNKNILQALRSDYKTKFPIYASMIESNFRKAMERKKLLEQGNKIFHSLFNNFPEVPYDCIERIFSYLSDEDLRILTDPYKPFNISNPNTNINDAVITSSIS